VSLIDLLRDGSSDVPPSHVPTPAELPGVLGALMVYVEHGKDAYKHAAHRGHQGFVDLFHPEEAEAAAAAALAAAPPDARDTEIAQLKAQLAAAQGVAQQTTASVIGEPERSG
jgi:hypothetical protein